MKLGSLGLILSIESYTASCAKLSTWYHSFPWESVISNIPNKLVSEISTKLKGIGSVKVAVVVFIVAEIAFLDFLRR